MPEVCESKVWYKSKTIFVNIIMLVLFIAENHWNVVGLPLEWQGVIITVSNLILRMFTDQPITKMSTNTTAMLLLLAGSLSFLSACQGGMKLSYDGTKWSTDLNAYMDWRDVIRANPELGNQLPGVNAAINTLLSQRE